VLKKGMSIHAILGLQEFSDEPLDFVIDESKRCPRCKI
jgi:hypothetical protein